MLTPEEITQEAKETIVKGSVATIIGTIPLVLLWGFPDIGNQLISLFPKEFSPKAVLTMLYIALVAILLLLAWVRSYRNKINELTELTPKNGIYWDNQGNAYCAKEKHLMSTHNQYGQMKNAYYCNPCKQLYQLPTTETDNDDDTDDDYKYPSLL